MVHHIDEHPFESAAVSTVPAPDQAVCHVFQRRGETFDLALIEGFPVHGAAPLSSLVACVAQRVSTRQHSNLPGNDAARGTYLQRIRRTVEFQRPPVPVVSETRQRVRLALFHTTVFETQNRAVVGDEVAVPRTDTNDVERLWGAPTDIVDGTITT